MSTTVQCPVCASPAPSLCPYDNHTRQYSAKRILKDLAAWSGWNVLRTVKDTATPPKVSFLRKFNVGIFKYRNIHRCRSCKLGFIHPALDSASLNDFYRYCYWDNHRESSDGLDTHVEFSRPRANIQYELISRYTDFEGISHSLEIGPGPGGISHRIKQVHPHIDFTAIEPSADWSESYSSSSVFTSVYKEIAALPRGASFDLVLSSHSLEHVSDLTDFMEQMKCHTHEGTILFLEVPNCSDAYFSTTNRDLPHTLFFTKPAIDRLAERFGFAVLELDTWGLPWMEPEAVPHSDGGPHKNEDGNILRAILKSTS